MVTHTEMIRQKGRSDVSSDLSSEEDNGQDWKDRTSFLEKENLRLKNQISELEDKVKTRGVGRRGTENPSLGFIPSQRWPFPSLVSDVRSELRNGA
jgi:hypothetical protein